MMIVAPASTHPPETIEVADIAPAPPAATAAAVPVIVTSQPVATTPNVNANDKFTPRVSTFHLYFIFFIFLQNVRTTYLEKNLAGFYL